MKTIAIKNKLTDVKGNIEDETETLYIVIKDDDEIDLKEIIPKFDDKWDIQKYLMDNYPNIIIPHCFIEHNYDDDTPSIFNYKICDEDILNNEINNFKSYMSRWNYLPILHKQTYNQIEDKDYFSFKDAQDELLWVIGYEDILDSYKAYEKYQYYFYQLYNFNGNEEIIWLMSKNFITKDEFKNNLNNLDYYKIDRNTPAISIHTVIDSFYL